MLLERSLSELQDNIVKIQLAFAEETPLPEDLQILHRSETGRLQQLILRMNLGQRRIKIALGYAYRRLREHLQGLHHLVDGDGTGYEQQRESHDKHHHAVFHNLMGQRQGHAVFGEIEEQNHGHKKYGCRNGHDSETQSCGKRLLVCQVVVVFKIRFLYQSKTFFTCSSQYTTFQRSGKPCIAFTERGNEPDCSEHKNRTFLPNHQDFA